MRRDTAKNLLKIVACLEKAGEWVWLREIARRCGLHHKTVARLLDRHLVMFVEVQTMEPFNLRMVRLKPETDLKKIARFLSVKEKLGLH